jgi:histone deacetylase 1/2
MAKNPMFHHRIKHIEIDVHFVHEWVASGVLSLVYIPGSDQIADIFTKFLCATKFIPNHGKLCLSPGPP